MSKAPFAFFRGIVIIQAAGVLAYFGTAIVFEIVNGSSGYGVVAWAYVAFIFLLGFLFAAVGGRYRYVWIGVMMLPVIAILLLILTSSFRAFGYFSGDDLDFAFFAALVGGGFLGASIGLGILARKALCRVVPTSVCEQL
jgi:hypothetical protein